MSLIIIDCEDATIETFSYSVRPPNQYNAKKQTALEEYRPRPGDKKSTSLGIILGKIVKVISYSEQLQRYVLLVKEYHPSIKYGEIFKAVVESGLARKLACYSPHTGDRIAFLDPVLFSNPAFRSDQSTESITDPKYVLHCRDGKGALMWFAKKQVMGGKSDDGKCVKQAKIPEKCTQPKASAPLKNNENESLPSGSNSGQCSDRKSKKKLPNVQALDNVRPKPAILLPKKPEILVNTMQLNSSYKYATISSIKLSGSTKVIEQSVNLFGVVTQIVKPISVTKKNKFMLVCKLKDDSDENNAMITFYFFTAEDIVIKKIEVGDVLRLHRVKLELYKDEIDGRVFFSHDVVIFKKGWPDIKPITNAKQTLITDGEKKRVVNLMEWYTESLKRPTLLSDIYERGIYCINCKVVKEPKREEDKVFLTVTDGSAINHLQPALPLERYKKKKKEDKKEHIVTKIIARNNLDKYASLKVDRYFTFFDVEAVEEGDEKLKLHIISETIPEMLAEKSLQTSDINSRIEKHLESIGRNNKPEKINCLNSRQDDSVIIVDEILCGKENQTSVQTRQQINKAIILPSNVCKMAKQFAKPVNYSSKSLSKHNNDLNNKGESNVKNYESDPGTKSRKQLFTPNYMTDLSDAATDDTSEHNLEMLKKPKHRIPEENSVKPSNSNFDEIIKKHSNKKQGHHCTSEHEEETNPSVVMLSRLSNDDSCKLTQDNCRKRNINPSENQEDDEDAETVLNLTLQANVTNMPGQGNKRTRLESLSTEEGNPRKNMADIDQEFENRGQKVSSWLFHPKNKIDCQEDAINYGYDTSVSKLILDGESQPNGQQDLSKYIDAGCFRLTGFLIDVLPDPLRDPMDLVSGYCHSGCNKMFLFSSIKWLHEETSNIPLCPECAIIEQENELQLMLMMELMIMEPTGRHGEVIVARNQAERFLRCSVAEFMKDEVVRTSRVQLLMDYTVQNTRRSAVTPMLDVCVTSDYNSPILLLVNTILKLPTL